MRHQYKVAFKNGLSTPVDGKKSLLAFLNGLTLTEISKIEWYVANGFWNDVTDKYIKRGTK